jgi:para-aminobenzoate synthetase component 1
MNPKPKIYASLEIELEAEELVYKLLSLERERRVVVLDSCGASGAGARFLIAGFDPFLTTQSTGPEVLIETAKGVEKFDDDILKLIDERLTAFTFSSQREFPLSLAGGCIAALSYDLGLRFEPSLLPLYEPHTYGEPDAFFAFYDTFIVHDYLRRKTFIVSCGGDERASEVYETIKTARDVLFEEEDAVQSFVTSNMTRSEYEEAVGRIKEYIAAGDIYQANLTQQLSCKLPSNSKPEQIFLRLRRHHPAPFGAFIQRREDTVVSASPERFLRVSNTREGRMIEAWPIKGTRPRGKTEEDDKQLREDLLNSEKDQAENIMIVDLLRNDIGRVCEFGSVVVDELCSLHEHPSLFHLVSKVRGRLRRDGVKLGDLLQATFPCGSITGAPKIRAMEIIDEIETAPRGLSMGAIGYIGFDGSMDLNVAIRTMVIRDKVARFNVGSGVVADSVPSNEYEESLIKAKALMRALNAEQ